MAEKRNWNVGLNAKGLEREVSEEDARRMCTTPGKRSVFVIDAHHGPFLTNEDGSIKMNLIIDSAELVPAEHEGRVRTFMRALYLSRPDQYGQAAFEEATPGERDVDSAAGALDAIVETDDKGEPTGIWDGSEEGSDTAPDPAEAEGDDGKVVEFSGSSKAR